jgi:hypothetical protein
MERCVSGTVNFSDLIIADLWVGMRGLLCLFVFDLLLVAIGKESNESATLLAENNQHDMHVTISSSLSAGESEIVVSANCTYPENAEPNSFATSKSWQICRIVT